MGDIADLIASQKKYAGCTVERALRELEENPGDLDSDDLAALRAVINNRDVSIRVVNEIYHRVGIRVHRDSLNQHRNHGNCAGEDR